MRTSASCTLGCCLCKVVARRRHGLLPEEIDAMTQKNMGRCLAWCDQHCSNSIFEHSSGVHDCHPAHRVCRWTAPPPPKPVPKAKWNCCHCKRVRIDGDDSFSRLGFRYCTIKCLNEHRPIADQASMEDDERGFSGAKKAKGSSGGGTKLGVSVGAND